MYKLSRQLPGHDSDVRGVTCLPNNSPVSCSRDGTVRQWHADNSGSILTASATNAFINCIEYVAGGNLIAYAGQEAIVYFIEPNNPNQEPEYALVAHEGNICSVRSSVATNEVITSSWDATARVWSLADFSQKHVLSHPMGVWDAVVFGDDVYVTAGADRMVRVWKGSKEIGQLVGHTDVVRALVKVDAHHVVSAANDGTIRVWNVTEQKLVNTLVGHESFIYSLAYNADSGTLASAGEDRSVRLWDLSSTVPKQVITLPCVSVWTVDFDGNGDMVVGSSDNYLRVFSADKSRVAAPEVLSMFEQSVESSSIAEQSVEIDRTDLPGLEALDKDGTEGKTIMVKNAMGAVEAHQWSGGQWHKIGEVVGAAKQGKKVEYGGVEWDYVFDVDVEDGKPPLKLPYNVNENPYAAADRFLAENELPSSYQQQVVEFIQQNTAGVQLEQSVGYDRASDPYMAKPESNSGKKENKETPESGPNIIPSETPILFSDFKAEQLAKGLAKFNETAPDESQLSGSELQSVEAALRLPHSQGATLVTTGLSVIDSWPAEAAVIGFDLLRVAIPFVPSCYDQVATAIEEALSKELSPVVGMMVLKTLNNLANFLPISSKVVEKAGKFISTVDSSHKQFGNAATAYATVLYTLSSEQAREGVDIVNGEKVVASSSEAAYRLVVAFGNLKYFGKATEKPVWVGEALQKYGSEPRFGALRKFL